MEPRILTLSGSRRTGKTTIAENYLNESRELGMSVAYMSSNSQKCKYFEQKTGLKTFYHPSHLVGNVLDILVVDEYEEFKKMYNDEKEYWYLNVFCKNVRDVIFLIN